MRKNTIMETLLLVSLLSINTSSLAEGNGDMTFRGTLIEPPLCTINNGDRIDVNFGDRVGINRVDGENYRQVMNYQISCEHSESTTWTMALRLEGNTVDFDADALLTSKENLGVRVYHNDTPFTPGSTLNINPASPPRLEAVLVKKEGAKLSEGTFETWATLRADYQ